MDSGGNSRSVCGSGGWPSARARGQVGSGTAVGAYARTLSTAVAAITGEALVMEARH